jgi:hypothetical protein
VQHLFEKWQLANWINKMPTDNVHIYFDIRNTNSEFDVDKGKSKVFLMNF